MVYTSKTRALTKQATNTLSDKLKSCSSIVHRNLAHLYWTK